MVALAAIPLVMLAVAVRPSRADNSAPCAAGCNALPDGVTVDPATYRLWPSGARTLLNTTWSPQSSVGVFSLLNSDASASPDFTLSVRVENHDPVGEALLTSTTFSYAVPALAPDESVAVGVPLDYTQCDIYIIVAPDSAAPITLRTGDPIAC